MAKNEKTSPRVGTIASKVLRQGYATPKDARTLAGATLTQRPDHRGGGGKGGGKGGKR